MKHNGIVIERIKHCVRMIYYCTFSRQHSAREQWKVRLRYWWKHRFTTSRDLNFLLLATRRNYA